jgi:hypothetical protein
MGIISDSVRNWRPGIIVIQTIDTSNIRSRIGDTRLGRVEDNARDEAAATPHASIAP